MRRAIATFLLAAFLVQGCASSRDERPEPTVRVIPISSIVEPIKPVDHEYDWEAVIQGHLTGAPVHDEVYRRPSGPVATVPVFCNKTRALGVYIEVDGPIPERTGIRPLRFTWSHVPSDEAEPARSIFRQAWFMPRVQGVLIYSDKMTLTKERRLDGEWEVAVFRLGEEIYREGFLLMDCDKPYAPEWFDDNEG